MNRRHAIRLIALVFSLTSCANNEDIKPVVQYASCPQVAVIRDLSVYQNPAAADENNLVISVRMGNIKGGCAYDEKGNQIEAGFDVAAVRGPNTAGKRASVPFFISVLNSRDEVVKKETYEIPIVFEDNNRQMRMNVPVNPLVATPPGDDPTQYRILIGFQLSSEQVDANNAFFQNTPSPR
jgi:hypothetical protein